MPIYARSRGLVLLVRFLSLSLLLALVSVNMMAGPGLRITIVEGDGAINNIRTHTAHNLIVEVRNEQDGVVPGASVVFQTPANGASAEFGDGMRSFITQTDSEGRATVHGLRPNSLTGPYGIQVTASFESLTANTIIAQTNAAPAEAKSSKKIWLIGLAAGAVAGGAFAASRGGKSGSNSSPPTSSTGAILPGSPSFGPPN